MSSEQLSLLGFEPPPPRKDSLFLAIIPDASTAAHLHQLAWELRATHGLQGKPIETARLHSTLHFIGDYAGVPENIVRDINVAATTAAALIPSFEMTLDRALSFTRKSRKQPFVVSSSCNQEGFIQLHQCLETELTKIRVNFTRMTNFKPHVTLLYDGQGIAEHPIEPVTWQVKEFVLVHSLLGQSKHTPLARWSLQG